ncbi:hypothetical protein ACXEI0_005052, partial [Klebsiella quasipneumoniae]
APAVSATMVNKLTTGRKNIGRVRRSCHPAKKRRKRVAWKVINACPAALRLPGVLRCNPLI